MVDGIRTVDSVKRSVVYRISDMIVIGDEVVKRCRKLLLEGVERVGCDEEECDLFGLMM